MSERTKTEKLIHRNVYGLMLIISFLWTIRSLSLIEIGPPTLGSLWDYINIFKVILLSIVVIFIHILTMHLDSNWGTVDAVTMTGIVVIVVWLFLVLWRYLVFKEPVENENGWYLVPLLFMPITGGSLIFFRRKSSRQKNENK